MKKYSKLLALALAAALVLPTGCAQASDEVTDIVLADSGVTVEGKAASTSPSDAVYVGADIVYYRDGTDSTYGEGADWEMHPAQEAAAHTVVTITQPGTYRLTGTLSQGQIAVDLGSDAKDDPKAVVTLILDGANVTCTVAPALIFYNVYECDRAWLAYDGGEDPDYQAGPEVDTTAAGANVVIAAGSENTFTGSHVARIYKEGTTKKLHKYDGAFYSKMSMNITGEGGDDSGVLNIVGDNEGLDSELHLTISGGTINITSRDDGINTNEDYVSVTHIAGGSLTVNAGSGSEGDGIDSNGFLVISGGTVWTMANETSPDGGIDADSPILIGGGTLYAFGTRNDAASSDSQQPYMELSFASTLPAGSTVKLTDEEGNTLWEAVTQKKCQSITLTTPELALDTVYHLYVDGVLQCWSGNSFGMMRPNGGGDKGGMEPPEGFEGGRPEGGKGDMVPPEGFDPSRLPQDFDPDRQPAEGFDKGQRPQDMGEGGQFGHGGMMDLGGETADGTGSTDFVLTEATKSFSGVCDSDSSGKTRVTFTVGGAERVGLTTVITQVTAITPSVEGLDPALVQITVTDDPSEDYAASCTLADGLEAVNALLPQADGDYLLTVAVASGNERYTGATQISFTVGALPFTDVTQRDEAYEAVKALWKAGAMVGTGGNRFSPEGTVTRAQAVTVLARLAGVEAQETDRFSDVEGGSWYAGYVGWAQEAGLVEGDGQGHFYPDRAVTAEEMALILGRWQENYAGTLGFEGTLTRAQLARMVAETL